MAEIGWVNFEHILFVSHIFLRIRPYITGTNEESVYQMVSDYDPLEDLQAGCQACYSKAIAIATLYIPEGLATQTSFY